MYKMLSWSLLVRCTAQSPAWGLENYWNKPAHEQPNEEAAREEACPALHEELASSAYGPYDDLYGYPTVGSQLLA
jgi:hypothetical protein